MAMLHGTCVEVDGVGVLLRGPPGSGKSDLAVRLLDEDARLIADDQVEITAQEGRLMATSPDIIDGLMEVRGMGVISVPNLSKITVELVVDLLSSEDIPRLPEPSFVELEHVRLPLFSVAPFEASATAKLRLAVRAVRHDIVRNG